MSNLKRQPARRNRNHAIAVEPLEGRALLAAATETFSGPSLTDLIQQARAGQVTAPAAIQRMVQALQTQLTSGPLADLKAGTVGGTDFVTEAQNLETSFEQNVDQQLLPEFPNVDKMIKLQGERVVADLSALNQQNSVGLISASTLASQAETAINSLTGGPVQAIGTPAAVLADQTTTFETNLRTLAQSLSASATPSLTVAQATTTATSEADAYQATVDAALSVTNPATAGQVDTALTNLENQIATIAQSGGSNAATSLTDALSTFDAAVRKALASYTPFKLKT